MLAGIGDVQGLLERCEVPEQECEMKSVEYIT